MTTKIIMAKPKQALNTEEACEFLQISKPSLYKYARIGVIPGRKIGTEWRFSKAALEKWLSGYEYKRGERYETNHY
ncbi:helix-turn-helix domain-containing protein [Carnobacterium pleistocenium]|uniref:helix-turn-helix domain-containing protein n=1 Tax=Carnobacterium pleistocenium TaxID=181073 RepID=UPI00055798B1|nr:helix-turn-helix domain-containing protein [Carnobacterium pleistocenium]